MKKILPLALLLSGCSTTMYGGIGYDIGGAQIQGVADTDTDTVIFQEDLWDNPIGIVGLRYPLGDHVELDYRHTSNLGSGNDIGQSDAVSVLIKIGGSRRGWGIRDDRP